MYILITPQKKNIMKWVAHVSSKQEGLWFDSWVRTFLCGVAWSPASYHIPKTCKLGELVALNLPIDVCASECL